MNDTTTQHIPDVSGRSLNVAAAAVALGATMLWLWSCFCSFPLHPWNAIRIAPAFMWTAGVTPYPSPDAGPVTTWIYGPLPLLVLWPATWATNAGTALVIAGAINLLIVIIPVVWVVRHHLPAFAGKAHVVMATALIVALWPQANLIFWQADNVAIALGYLSIVVIGEAKPHSRTQLWLASAAAVLALWAKPTELGPSLGQVAWMGLCFGTRAALVHLARCATSGAGAGLIFFSLFGAEGLVFNMFVVPAGLPLVPLIAKAVEAPFLPHVLLVAVVPTLIVLATVRRVLARRDELALCYLMFLASLPPNLIGFSSIGGNVNSLHAHLYLLPALIWGLSPLNFWRRPLFFPSSVIMTGLVLGLQFGNAPVFTLRPATAATKEAEQLVRNHAGRLYLPWHPLATYFGEGRFDHAEDGIMTRALAGRPLNDTALRQSLPPAFSMVAYQEFVYEGFVTQHMVPDGAEQSSFGNWRILSWSPSSWRVIPTQESLRFAPAQPAPLDPSIVRPR